MPDQPHHVRIAEAFRAGLATHFAGRFTPVRAFQPVYEPEELRDLKVTVIGRAESRERISRTRAAVLYELVVGVQQRVERTDVAELERLTRLVEEIVDYAWEAGPMAGAVFLGSEQAPLWNHDHLKQHGVFTAVATLTYRGER